MPEPGLPAAFWRAVRNHDRYLLLLDYDGTLAPFVAERDRAFPHPGVEGRLESIIAAENCRTVIVTGRPVADIPRLLRLPRLPEIWGCHGWERLRAEGRLESPGLPQSWRRALVEAAALEGIGCPPHAVERKPFSVAVHWRGLDGGERERLQVGARRLLGELAERYLLELHPFDGGLELRCPGRDKGSVVRDLLAEEPPSVCVVYLGDDLTDEDAFAALEGRGQGILVREEVRPTRATWWIRPPNGLLRFLDDWKKLLVAGGTE
ncbi:trehalose 6-phosphatase [Geothermobacter ehrlichii]|uniref:Trehalose 6-phosphate phosphatase n=1 Tax=Geothermobacter ehrlichii TaxID=213224 RepID=A0A5D3WL72_9BACT|nr:trehalose-phosphatase [Geothermobacter ehrlichii]TYO99191.1 trehalose 6-phosphatase [Geothermobacter ehrlichii]